MPRLSDNKFTAPCDAPLILRYLICTVDGFSCARGWAKVKDCGFERSIPAMKNHWSIAFSESDRSEARNLIEVQKNWDLLKMELVPRRGIGLLSCDIHHTAVPMCKCEATELAQSSTRYRPVIGDPHHADDGR